jgi:hypothetical protein
VTVVISPITVVGTDEGTLDNGTITIPGDPGIVTYGTLGGRSVGGTTTGDDQIDGTDTVGGIVTIDGTGVTIGTKTDVGNVDGSLAGVIITVFGDPGMVTYGTDVGSNDFVTAYGLVQCGGIVTDVETTTTTVVTAGKIGVKNEIGYVDGKAEYVTITTDGDPGIVTMSVVGNDGGKIDV